ncbi:hypothetical protein RRG08_045122 [Elysia crispata]|uniref:Uncharacterized protein n=1 Tax=Elysia crispata TaxID=231223 RepID=A0AAE0YTF2_9GAST|nr:hypothetical protein RRG08_045122 [Elysia crispata]
MYETEQKLLRRQMVVGSDPCQVGHAERSRPKLPPLKSRKPRSAVSEASFRSGGKNFHLQAISDCLVSTAISDCLVSTAISDCLVSTAISDCLASTAISDCLVSTAISDCLVSTVISYLCCGARLALSP